MTQYTCRTESSHIVICHDDKALADYQKAVVAGDAEPLVHVSSARLDRADHRWAFEQGNCYGPCRLVKDE